MTKATLIKGNRVTEKAALKAEQNVYTFNVLGTANKTEIKKEIFAKYKVKPVKVNVVSIKKKVARLGNNFGSKGGGKKVFVYLKKGDKIEFA